MKEFNNHIFKIFFICSILLVTLSCFNYSLDLYGIFSNRKHFENFSPNERSLKLNYIIKSDRSKLIFSDSRGGNLNNRNKFKKWYNMSYSMGVPEEFLEDITYLLKKKKKLDEVIIFIDEVSLFEIYENHQNQLIRKKIDLESIQKYQYLLIIPNLQTIKFLIQDTFFEKKYTKSIVYDIYNTGSYIEKNFNYKDKPSKCFEIDSTVENKTNTIVFNKKYQILKELKSLCESNSIKIRFVSHPISSENFKINIRIQSYLKFLNFLGEQGFKIIKPLKCQIIEYNQNLWRDYGHYNNMISNKIENQLLN